MVLTNQTHNTQQNQTNPGLVASYDIQPGNRLSQIWNHSFWSPPHCNVGCKLRPILRRNKYCHWKHEKKKSSTLCVGMSQLSIWDCKKRHLLIIIIINFYNNNNNDNNVTYKAQIRTGSKCATSRVKQKCFQSSKSLCHTESCLSKLPAFCTTSTSGLPSSAYLQTAKLFTAI